MPSKLSKIQLWRYFLNVFVIVIVFVSVFVFFVVFLLAGHVFSSLSGNVLKPTSLKDSYLKVFSKWIWPYFCLCHCLFVVLLLKMAAAAKILELKNDWIFYNQRFHPPTNIFSDPFVQETVNFCFVNITVFQPLASFSLWNVDAATTATAEKQRCIIADIFKTWSALCIVTNI